MNIRYIVYLEICLYCTYCIVYIATSLYTSYLRENNNVLFCIYMDAIYRLFIKYRITGGLSALCERGYQSAAISWLSASQYNVSDIYLREFTEVFTNDCHRRYCSHYTNVSSHDWYVRVTFEKFTNLPI